MSRETIEWLNNNVLIGFTDDKAKWSESPLAHFDQKKDRVEAWFETDGYTGAYPGAIPVEDIMARLFHWEAVSGKLTATIPCDLASASGLDAEGVPYKVVEVPGHQAIVRSDNGATLGIFKNGYQPHQYGEWLVQNVSNLIDADVQANSAGLLMGGGVAWVSVSLPDTIVGRHDFGIRPNLLSYTSLNGMHSTTYQQSTGIPMCDNTLDMEISSGAQHGKRVKIKHSSKSMARLEDARSALDLLIVMGEEMSDFFDQLYEWEVTDKQFMAIVDLLEPMPEAKRNEKGTVTNQQALNNADRRRTDIAMMYAMDDRASQYRGSALGVLQAVNTWHQHERTNSTMERQMRDTLNGEVGKLDSAILSAIEVVTDRSVLDIVSPDSLVLT